LDQNQEILDFIAECKWNLSNQQSIVVNELIFNS